jgi:hypothetical protein|tara:strand:+ start:4362 stop:4511 length:150 start_codon:yes stop_codon:yes gene_type:complete
MMKQATQKPYFTQASKSMGGKPEKFGLPSNKQIANSVYKTCGGTKKGMY